MDAAPSELHERTELVQLPPIEISRYLQLRQASEQPAPVSFAGNIPGSAEWEAYALAADAGLELRLSAKAGTPPFGSARATFGPNSPANGRAFEMSAAGTGAATRQ